MSELKSSSPSVDNERVLLNYKSKKGQPVSIAALPVARQKQQVCRDNTETSRDVSEIREAPPANDISTAEFSTQALPPVPTARQRSVIKSCKQRIITPQMVKRRNINSKHPLVMKSDESTSGRDSTMTEMTEKASNRKTTKRRQNMHVSSGKMFITRERGVDGELEKVGENSRMGKGSLPPLYQGATTTGNDTQKDNAEETNEEDIAPFLHLNTAPSGQSCSAFFLGDASTGSGINSKKEKKEKTVAPKSNMARSGKSVGSRSTNSSSSNQSSNSNNASKLIEISPTLSAPSESIKTEAPDGQIEDIDVDEQSYDKYNSKEKGTKTSKQNNGDSTSKDESTNALNGKPAYSVSERIKSKSSDSNASISTQSTDMKIQAILSDCEYSSVQSSITTDKLCETQPSILKRTSSLIRNPLLRRNRSKNTDDMDDLIQCMRNGTLAANTDNNKVEKFDDEKLFHNKKRHHKRQYVTRDEYDQHVTKTNIQKHEGFDFDNKITPFSVDPSNSDDIDEIYDFNDQGLRKNCTFDNSLNRSRDNLPDIKSEPRVSSPLAQQIMINALNDREASSGVRGTSSEHIAINANSGPANASSFGTFGDVVETVGLFSARLCLGTGAAIVSCSRACNDNPSRDVRQVSLAGNSFVEPDIGVFSSPRNVERLSPRNGIFRDGPSNRTSASGGYTLALANAISKMPEEEQLDLVRQLSSKSYIKSPSYGDIDDMASSVDGMFQQHRSRHMKRVPHNIAMKSKAKYNRGVEDATNTDKRANIRKPFAGLRKGIKRLAKTRLAIMYQV